MVNINEIQNRFNFIQPFIFLILLPRVALLCPFCLTLLLPLRGRTISQQFLFIIARVTGVPGWFFGMVWRKPWHIFWSGGILEGKWSSCFYLALGVLDPGLGVTKVIFRKGFGFARKSQVLSFHWYLVSESWTRSGLDIKCFDMSGFGGAPNFGPPWGLSGGPQKSFFRCFGIYWCGSSNPPKIFKIGVGPV